MIIILEGIDGSGKTTLAKKISSELDCPIYGFCNELKYTKFLHAWKTGITDFMLLDFLKEMKLDRLIIDRCLLTNFVYRKEFDEEILEHWLNYVNLLKIKLIYLFGKDFSDRKASDFPRYEEVCISDTNEILFRYNYALEKTPKASFIRIDSSKFDAENVFNIAMEFLNDS